MHRFFFAIHAWVNKYKALAVAAALALLGLMVFFALQIRFTEDISKLIPANGASSQTIKVLNQLNFSDKITIIVQRAPGASDEDLVAYATATCDSLQAQAAPYLKSIQGRVDEAQIGQTIDFVYEHLPLFLEPQDYENLALRINPDSLAQTVSANYKTLISPSGLVARDFILKDPLGLSYRALGKLQQLNTDGAFTLHEGFIMTQDRQQILLFLNPKTAASETEQNSLLAARLYQIRDKLNHEFKGKAQGLYFGPALIAVANAAQIKSDIVLSTSIAMAALMLILILFYRRIFIPLVIFLPTLFGAVFAVAFLCFVKGTISAISLGIGSILIGITIDYSLHIMTHHKHNSNVAVLYKDITMPLVMSSTTTALAFLCLLFVHSEALQDLGIFAAAITVASAFFSLLFVPHLYKPKADNFEHKPNWIDRTAQFSFHRSKWLGWGCAAVVVLCFFTFNKVRFNSDLSALNFIPSEQKTAEKALERSSNLASKSIYLAAYGNSAEAVAQSNRNLYQWLETQRDATRILQFSSLGNIVLPQHIQQQKIAQWQQFWTPERKLTLQRELIKSGAALGFKPESYQAFYDRLSQQDKPIPVTAFAQLPALQLPEFLNEKEGFYTFSSLVKVNPGQREPLMKAVAKMTGIVAIDRQEINESFLDNLKTDFNNLVNYSFIAVLLILFVFFRRVELVLVAAIPIAVTGIVTAGLMGIFGLEFNVFSTIVCTLVFGHGVDFSIFMTSALQKEYTDGRNEMAVYRTSILLAVITTILGIGAMVFAQHPALRSISSVSLVGVFAALIITFIFYPLLFRLLISGRAKKGLAPLELFTLVHSILSFAYFGLGGLLMSVLSLLLKIVPLSAAKKMYAFRWLMSKYMGSVLRTNLFVKQQMRNPQAEDFSKPAVIIANHTSFLDILVVGKLHPKLIYLVSDWVYHSPVFGKALRAAGFYPVSDGIEGSVEHLRPKIEQGYSLVVFPEGTRSQTNEIKRFHKGAFYLAQHFDLDIVPVLIHGNSETLPKGDFIIYDRKITVEILPRIPNTDLQFGADFATRSKKIAAYFKASFAALREELEGPEYFRHELFNAFRYKDPEIEKAAISQLKSNFVLYHMLGKQLAPKARILHWSDDFGQLDALLALQQPQRRITSFTPDVEKRAVAQTLYLNQRRHVEHLESVEQTLGKDFEVTLISTTRDFEQLSLQTTVIILLQTHALLTSVQSAGYRISHQQPNLIVLTRESAL